MAGGHPRAIVGEAAQSRNGGGKVSSVSGMEALLNGGLLLKVNQRLAIKGTLNVLVSQPLQNLPNHSLGRRERRAVNLHGFAARQDGTTAAVKLTDLSYDGCGLETTAEYNPGERIELSILRRGAIVAHVCWCVDGRAGLTFEAIPAAQKRLSRTSKRTEVAAEVALRRSGRPSFRVRVLEVSLTGCKLELVDRPDVDEQVWIKFDGLEAIEAIVRWTAGFKAGLKYANPIHPAVFELMLTRFRGSGAES